MPSPPLPEGTPLMSWALTQLRTSLGPSAVITEVNLVPARVATLARLRVQSDAGTAAFYLKQDPDVPREGAPWPDHCVHLHAVSQAFHQVPGLLPFPLLSADAGLRATLSADVQGDTAWTYYRRSLRSGEARRQMVAMWGGVGRWLSRLHDVQHEPITSARAEALGAYVVQRLEGWKAEDPGQTALADAALAAVGRLTRQLTRDGGTATLCHGDVSVGNILTRDGAVVLIDMDDLRVDLPGMDVSQALTEIDEFTRFSSTFRIPGFHAAAVKAFRAGYASPWPTGPAFWLPHLRNLAVAAITLAPHRQTQPRIWTNRRYRRVIREIRRTVIASAPE